MVAQLAVSVSEAGLPLTYGIEGVVQVFTCPQRHFFTTVMAQALRVAAQGSSVIIVQLLKGEFKRGLNTRFSWDSISRGGGPALQRCLGETDTLTPQEKAAVRELWQHLQTTVQRGSIVWWS